MAALDARLSELRAFLMDRRSRLTPADVGLPEVGRRRVPGLRRSEVAELAGVSELWYRLFESGRDLTVSRHFLAALSEALRLDEHDRALLYRLAIDELYQAERSSEFTPLIAPVGGYDNLEESVKSFAKARDRFLSGETPDGITVRARILQSWQRSLSENVEVEKRDHVVIAGREEMDHLLESNRALLMAAKAVDEHLSDKLGAERFAVILTDANGVILELLADRSLRRRLESLSIQCGTYMCESCLGTNGIGTAIVDHRPLQIVGPEHFWEPWRILMCNGVPVRDPQTGEIAGILDATADYRLARPELMGVMLQYAYAIEEQMALDNSHSQHHP